MKTIILHILLLVLLPFSLEGQEKYSDTEVQLGELFSRLSADSTDTGRLRINDSIRTIISEYASSEEVFTHNFPALRYLGQVTSPDSLLKIISWNLNLADYKGKYFSYIIRRGNIGERNRVNSLAADYNDRKIVTDTTLTEQQWYGVLYYAVKPVVFAGDTSWIVLGLDYGNPAVTRKVIDVVSFNGNGEIVFGKKWFNHPAGMKFRVIFEYASSAMMTLRFSSDSSIVFDHLVAVPALTSNNRVFYGPDYSYDSYVFEKGIWNFKRDVDARNRE